MYDKSLFQIFNTARRVIDLKSDETGAVFGRSCIDYEIYKRTDVSNLKQIKGYLVLVRQRIVIPSTTSYSAGSTSITAYQDYPAIIENRVNIDVNNNANVVLDSVFPRTLNSSISTNSTSSSESSSSITHQNTVGSNSSNVNTFGVSIGGGFFGPQLTGELLLNYSHSWERSTSSENSSGGATSTQTNVSHSNSMSVKDWSAYSSVEDDDKSLTWLWGQTYPWDVILYNQASSGDNIYLPKFVAKRLVNDNIVLPPSELSLFGLDFTSHASWRIDFPNGITEDEIMKITHETTYFTASHTKDGSGGVSATLQSAQDASDSSYDSGDIDLSLYALAAIGRYQVDNAATIGLRVDDFTLAPKSHTDKFKIISPLNDMQVSGSGFDSAMTTTFKSDVSLNVYFKVEDTSFNYSLNLLNWLEKGDSLCKISWIINERYKGSSTISDVKNAESQDNVTRIPLRNRDFESVNYYDYLVPGLNVVEISVKPVDPSATARYTLSTVAIR